MHVSSLIKNKSTVNFLNIYVSFPKTVMLNIASNYFVHKHWLVGFDSKFSTELNKVYSSVKQIQTISILQPNFNSTTHLSQLDLKYGIGIENWTQTIF